MFLNNKVQEALARRKQRWLDIYDPAQPPSSLFLIRHWNELGDRPFPRMDNLAERIDYAWRKYQLQIEQLEWLEEDTLPYLEAYSGPEIFATAFGCTTYYPEVDMPFALPRITTAEEVQGIEIPDLNTPPIAALFEIADELRRRAGDQALMHLVDIQSSMDISALIWNKVYFYPAMIQNPEEVRQLAAKVQTFLMRFLDEWFARYGREFIAHYPDYYMPYGVTLSEDEIGAVSGKMFDKYFLPGFVELSERYGQIGMHCSAHARHQWKNFLKVPGLRLLNLVQPADMVNQAVDFFKDQVVQWHSYYGEGPAWTWPAQHPPEARMIYEIWVNSKEEALETSARMREALGR